MILLFLTVLLIFSCFYSGRWCCGGERTSYGLLCVK